MRIRDSLTGEMREFKEYESINIYVCGPTVYADPHLGHARSCLVFDLMYRTLKTRFAKVNFVQNITDIAESIDKKAEQEQTSSRDIAIKYEKSFMQALNLLNISKGITHVKVSEFIPEMIEYIDKIMKNGHGYLVNGDGIYFRISNFHYDLFENRGDEKDFALWKFREIGYESPWGTGIPGWHIECSVVSQKLLGDEIHIHGGGSDLKFPHHQNEIVQHWAWCNGTHLTKHDSVPVKAWVHNEMLNINNEKMSKSLGNFCTIQQLVKNEYDADVFRCLVMKTHYSKVLDFDMDYWAQNQEQMNVIRAFYFKHDIPAEYWGMEILENDLDSVRFMSTLMTMIAEQDQRALGMIRLAGWYMKPRTSLSVKSVEEKLRLRKELRESGQYAQADAIRRDLINEHVAIYDGIQTTWHYL